MIESWDDALTLQQKEELRDASFEALISLEKACKNNDIQVRLEIAYMDGMRLCFYPEHIAKDFWEKEYSGLVVEHNFGRMDSRLFPVGGYYSPDNEDWAAETFRLTPKFLSELTKKLHAKVSE